MKRVIVLRGPCGAGKTTVAREMCRRVPNSVHINIDDIKKKMSGSVHVSCPGDPEQWFEQSNALAKQELTHDKSVILDEAFAYPHLLSIATNGLTEIAKVFIVEIRYDDDEHVSRYHNKPTGMKEHPTDEVIQSYITDYDNNGRRITNDLVISDPNLKAEQIAEEIISKSGL